MQEVDKTSREVVYEYSSSRERERSCVFMFALIEIGRDREYKYVVKR